MISYAAELLEGIGILEFTAGRPVLLTGTGQRSLGRPGCQRRCVCTRHFRDELLWEQGGRQWARDQLVVRRKKGGQPIDDLGQANWQDWMRKASWVSRAKCKEAVLCLSMWGGSRKQELKIFFSSKARQFECLRV